ncbi:glutamate 5-kinase [Candidatus Entotheonella palauensis]|nr:glutamate 5-kinase [Candidatus Entotheonella palauensis]
MTESQRPVQRLVVKIGSGLIRTSQGRLNEDAVRQYAKQLATLRKYGVEVILVSSGAIALGMPVLQQQRMPRTTALQQAAAAIGQSHLIWNYERLFGMFNQQVAQILLTHADLRNRGRYLNARNTLQTLIAHGVIPIINENDTVSVEEIRFGDNDSLSAMVCNLIDADTLIILTDIDGLYTADPRLDPNATLIPVVEHLDRRIEALAGRSTHATGRGGMYSKIQAAKIAGASGIHTYIANGLKPNIITHVLDGEAQCTHIHPSAAGKLSSRKRWIGYALKAKGTLVVDDGAKRALTIQGKSLLPSGIIKVSGSFRFGDAVYCTDASETCFAQGLVNYSSQELMAIIGQHTSHIKTILGNTAKAYDEVIHRDNLVLL